MILDLKGQFELTELRQKKRTTSGAWVRFFIGIVILAAVVSFFASGYSPPGICGEVLRNNQANDIDATPLLYMEVENMSALEDTVRMMMDAARSRADSLSG